MVYRTFHTKPGTPKEIPDVFSPWLDGVRRGLEMPNCYLGDRLSDSYFELVDLATEPSPVTNEKIARIERILQQLMANSDFISTYIDDASGMYDTTDLGCQYAGVLSDIATMYNVTLESN